MGPNPQGETKSTSGFGPGGPDPLADLDWGDQIRGGPNPQGHWIGLRDLSQANIIYFRIASPNIIYDMQLAFFAMALWFDFLLTDKSPLTSIAHHIVDVTNVRTKHYWIDIRTNSLRCL